MLKQDKGSLVLRVRPFSLNFYGVRLTQGKALGFYAILNEDSSLKGYQSICPPWKKVDDKLFSERELENHIKNGWFTVGKHEDFWA